MAYYRITIKIRELKRKKVIVGIREMDADVDTAWRYFHSKAETQYQSHLEDFELVQLCKLSKEVKEYLKKPRRPPVQ